MRRSRTVAGAVACLLALAACTGLPTDGPVVAGDVDIVDPGVLDLQVYGPVADASPEQIVRGFISAQAGGVSEGFETARQFLTEASARTWNPLTRTTVYSGDLTMDAEVDAEGAATLTGQASVTATLDPEGRYTEAAASAVQELSFGLRTDASGQWRIDDVADGVFLSQPNFASVYRATSVYFLTPDSRYLVPDPRWFPQRNTATYAVQALLAGPSTWLQDSVVTGVPVGTDLEVDAVSVDASGVARVDLTSAVLPSTEEQRGQLLAQLDATLLRIAGVRSVDLLAAGTPLSVTAPITPQRDPAPPTEPVALSGGELVTLRGREVEQLAGYASVADLDVTALARGEDDDLVYLRVGSDAIVQMRPDGAPPAPLIDGADLVAPSVDRFEWVWSGEGDGSSQGALQVVRASGEQVTVSADWLEGQELVSVRVSRDGARLAIVSRSASTVQIDVAGIVRDDQGAPQRLSEQRSVGASLSDASQVVWIDEATLAVLGESAGPGPDTVYTVPLGGRTEAMSSIEGATSIASGRGQRAIYVGTDSGQLFTRRSTGVDWVLVSDDVSDLAYAG